MSLLTSKPFVAMTTCVISLAMFIQAILVLNNMTIGNFVIRSLFAFFTFRARFHYSIELSSNSDHHLCYDNQINAVTSCEMLAYNDLFKVIIPNYAYMRTEAPETFLSSIRNELAAKLQKTPPFGTIYDRFNIGHLPILLIHSDVQNALNKEKIFAANNGVIVYFHGGGFSMGTFESSHRFASYLHLFSNLPVIAVNYRLCPEYPLHKGTVIQDAERVIYDYLYNKMSVPLDHVFVTGESAGGTLSMMVMQYFAAKRKQQLGGGVFMSAAIDLESNVGLAPSLQENSGFDNMLTMDSRYLFSQHHYGCRDNNGQYVQSDLYDDIDECIEIGRKELNEENLNPLTSDWSVFNSKTNMFFIASEFEILRDHSLIGHGKALKYGINSKLEIVANSSIHALSIFIEIPEAFKSVQRIAQTINEWNSQNHH